MRGTWGTHLCGDMVAQPYPALFTRTTVIFSNPSSKTGGLSFSAILRITSSLTERSRWRLRSRHTSSGTSKKDGLHLVAKALGHLDPLAALVDGEVRGVNVVRGHAGDKTRAQQRAEGGKDQTLVALLLHIVKEDVAQKVRESGVMPRRPNQVVLPEPGRPMASTTKPLGA